MPSLEHTVVLPYLGDGSGSGGRAWSERSSRRGALRFEPVPFDHPLWVLYSSGTTGLPKAIVQGQGGILLEHLKKLHLHVDAQEGDRLFWFTTTGWMMWNFLVSGLLTEAAIVLYDGNPAYPSLDMLWDFAAETGMTCFGTSASYIASCMKAGVEPGKGRDLSALRSVGSTGSPLAPEGFEWVYEHVGGTRGCSPQRRHRRLQRLRRRRAAPAGLPRRAPGARARREGRGLRRGGQRGRSTRSASSSSRSRCPRCRCTSGTTRTASATRSPTSRTTRGSGATATGWRSPRAARRSSRAAPTRRSTAAACGWGRARSTAPCSRVREIVDALVVDVGRRRLDAALRRAARRGGARRRRSSECGARIREDCSPRHVPERHLRGREIPRTLSNKVLEVPVKRILTGSRPRRRRAATRWRTPRRSTTSPSWRRPARADGRCDH